MLLDCMVSLCLRTLGLLTQILVQVLDYRQVSWLSVDLVDS